MKKYLWMLPAVCVMACGTETKTNEPVVQPVEEKTTTVNSAEEKEVIPVTDWTTDEEIIGSYVGDFEAKEADADKDPSYSNRINISIDSVKDEKVFGHSVVAGNSRPFTGTVKSVSAGSKQITAVEPGDDMYDGKFEFTMSTNETATGTWKANNSKLAVTERTFTLTRMKFTYDPTNSLPDISYRYLTESMNVSKGEIVSDDARKFNASVDELKKEDIENMTGSDLEIMRNTIYARHGYSFKNRKMRYFFDSNIDWYIPVSTDVRNDLTALEKKNIELIKRYEEHAARYYDTFGR